MTHPTPSSESARRLRMKAVCVWLMHASILSLGGIAAAAAVPLLFGASLSELVHASHGVVGAFLGFAFCFGVAATNVIAWVLTGRNLLDRLIGL